MFLIYSQMKKDVWSKDCETNSLGSHLSEITLGFQRNLNVTTVLRSFGAACAPSQGDVWNESLKTVSVTLFFFQAQLDWRAFPRSRRTCFAFANQAAPLHRGNQNMWSLPSHGTHSHLICATQTPISLFNQSINIYTALFIRKNATWSSSNKFKSYTIPTCPQGCKHTPANIHKDMRSWTKGPEVGNTEPSAPGPHYRPWPPALRGILSRLRLSHFFPHLIQPPGNLCATTREAWFGEVKEWPSFPDHGFRYQRNPFGKYVTL